MPQSTADQAKRDLKHALNIVINGLENGQFSREEIDMLSHSLGMSQLYSLLAISLFL